MSSPFEPKKLPYRKYHKGNKGHIPGVAGTREFTCLQGGNAVIQMTSNIRVTSKNFEVMRLLCSKAQKSSRRGSFKFPNFPHRSLTKKAAETRMGGGKGSPELYVAYMKAGSPLIEFFDMPRATIEAIHHTIRCKIPGSTELIFTGDYHA